jgi:hypothetical protein
MSAGEWIDVAATLVRLALAIVAVLTLRENRRLGAAAVEQAEAARRQARRRARGA